LLQNLHGFDAACLASTQAANPNRPSKAGGRSKSFVAPGKYDFYNIVSEGHGQVAVYGIPSGRLFRIIPVFSNRPKVAMVSVKNKADVEHFTGFVPWDDQHHIALSQTKVNMMAAGFCQRYTPRLARMILLSGREIWRSL
jgi:nitrous-oxide reductase